MRQHLTLISLFTVYLTSTHANKEQEPCRNGHIVNNSHYECHLGPQSIFEYLIYPISTMQFNTQYFQNQPLYIPRQDHKYYNIESTPFVNAYKNIVNILDQPSIYDSTYPQIRIISYNPNATTNKLKYSKIKPSRADKTHFDIAAITQLLHSDSNNKYTIKFGNTQKHLNAVNELSFALSTELGVGVRASLFYTQPGAKFCRAHFPTEDIFILQLKGSSNWKVYSNMFKYCNSLYKFANGEMYPWNVKSTDSEKEIEKKSLTYCHANVVTNLSPPDETLGGYGLFNDDKLSQFAPTIDTIINAGDLLYFPRGFVHDPSAINVSVSSVHLALGIYQELQCDFLFVLIQCLFKMDSFDSVLRNMFNNAVSMGGDVNDVSEAVLGKLEYFLTYQSFMDTVLRDIMPYGFYYYDIFENVVYDNIVIPLIENTFEKFIRFIKIGNSKEHVQNVVNVLRKGKIRKEIGEKIYVYYDNAILEFNGVYLPTDMRKEHGKRFKRISYGMRNLKKRKNLAKVFDTIWVH